jgi:hypothetical protein
MPCTKGLWIWGKPVDIDSETVLIIMDTEGLNSVRTYLLNSRKGYQCGSEDICSFDSAFFSFHIQFVPFGLSTGLGISTKRRFKTCRMFWGSVRTWKSPNKMLRNKAKWPLTFHIFTGFWEISLWILDLTARGTFESNSVNISKGV